jgi:prophage maintenance system killer protein
MNVDIKEKKGEIIIFRGKEGEPSIQVRLEAETVWLSQKLMAELFQKNTDTVGLHLKNIFSDGELDEKSTTEFFSVVQKEGKRTVTRKVAFYNLDAIISVGYRVNSKRGTQFRIWATNVLRNHLVQGYTLNEKRLKEDEKKRLKELEGAVALVKAAQTRKELTAVEAAGLLAVITDYTRTWLLLHQYDAGTLTSRDLNPEVRYELTHKEATMAIAELKKQLTQKKEAGDIFGVERESAFKAILGNIRQTFGGKDLYPSLEEKAAHLLYFIIKDHPFTDGNKRIASLMFIWFLDKNDSLYTTDGVRKFNDNALVALALLIAESNPKQKDLMIRLIINLIQ